jgi:hypothetical protein
MRRDSQSLPDSLSICVFLSECSLGSHWFLMAWGPSLPLFTSSTRCKKLVCFFGFASSGFSCKQKFKLSQINFSLFILLSSFFPLDGRLGH